MNHKHEICILISGYILVSVALKVLTHFVCEFFVQSWHVVFAHGLHMFYEAVLITCFYSWYIPKVYALKNTMREAINNRSVDYEKE